MACGAAAHAEMDEWQLSLGPAYRGIVYDVDPSLALHAPGATFGGWYGLDDFWQLGGAVHAGVAFPIGDAAATLEPAPLAAATVEVRYVLDIVEWVPHVDLAAGVMWSGSGRGQPASAGPSGSSDGAFDAIVGVGLGLDYRPARDWSLGLTGRYDFVLSDWDGVSAAYLVTLVYSFYISNF